MIKDLSDAQLSFEFMFNENVEIVKDNVFYVDFSKKITFSFFDENSDILSEIVEEAKHIKWE